jgi:hypothetical protein
VKGLDSLRQLSNKLDATDFILLQKAGLPSLTITMTRTTAAFLHTHDTLRRSRPMDAAV